MKLRKEDLSISENIIYFYSTGPRKTYQFALLVGAVLKAHSILCLYGELGAGKTIFAKGVASSIGVDHAWDKVVSPSFLLIKEYEAKVPVIHIDLYRIRGEDDVINLGIQEYFSKKCILLIEWAQHMKSILPQHCIDVYSDIQGTKTRSIRIEGLKEEQIQDIQSEVVLT